MKPMCAFRFQDRGHKLPDEVAVQPKLNGVRALYNKGVFQSRWEKFWLPGKLDHIAEALSALPDNIMTDGELYIHGRSLQQINKAISINSPIVTPETLKVEYWIYDVIYKDSLRLSFRDRHASLVELFKYLSHPAVLVPTKFCTRLQAEQLFPKFKAAGYEGMMYRTPDAAYGLLSEATNKENRWECLQKRKDFLDAIVTIVDWKFGEDKYSECVGSVICEYTNGQTFAVGSGFSDAERHRMLLDSPIGERIRIKYEMLSDTGVPLKATFESFFGDEH